MNISGSIQKRNKMAKKKIKTVRKFAREKFFKSPQKNGLENC